MKVRPWVWLLLVPLLWLMLLAGTAAAADELVPKTLQNLNPTHPPLSERYPIWAYSNDGNITDGSVRQLQHLINGLNLTKAWGLKAGLRSVEYAVTWRMPEELLDQAEQQLGALRALLWEGDLSALVTAAIVLTGGAALWLAGVMGRGRAAWGILMRTLLVLVLAAIAFETAGPGLKALARADGQVNTLLFAAVNRVSAPADARGDEGRTAAWALTGAGDVAWRTVVVYPWAVQEFGSLETARRYQQGGLPGGLLLEKSPSERLDWYWQQQAAARDRDLRWWTEEAVPRRLTVAVAAALGALALTLGLLLVAGGALVWQAMLLFLCALAPLAFVLALWPGFGGVMLRRWGRAALRAAVGQVVSVALLAVGTALMQVAGTLEEPLGWEALLFLLAGLAVGLALVWRGAMLRWVRRPASLAAPGPGTGAPSLVRTLKERVLPVRSEPERTMAVTTPVPAPVAGGGAEVVAALTQEVAASRTRMLVDMETGRFAQRPQGMMAEGGTVAGRPGAPGGEARVVAETSRPAAIPVGGGQS